jgi:ketosteroid isomerase-like protein
MITSNDTTIPMQEKEVSVNQDEEFAQAINSLWAAWSRKDIAALEALVAEDYVEFSGSTACTVGKANVVKVAHQFFQSNSINGWTIQNLMIQR